MGDGELLDRIDLFVFDGAVGRRMFFMSEHQNGKREREEREADRRKTKAKKHNQNRNKKKKKGEQKEETKGKTGGKAETRGAVERDFSKQG